MIVATSPRVNLEGRYLKYLKGVKYLEIMVGKSLSFGPHIGTMKLKMMTVVDGLKRVPKGIELHELLG